MAVTTTWTYIGEQVFGSEKVMDWKGVMSGTFTSAASNTFTPQTFGLDVVDYITWMIDGSAAQTNGVFLLDFNLKSNTIKLYVSGASSGAAFVIASNPTTVTGFTFFVRVYGVA